MMARELSDGVPPRMNSRSVSAGQQRADAQLVELVRERGRHSDEAKRLADSLAEYGVGTLLLKWRDGTLGEAGDFIGFRVIDEIAQAPASAIRDLIFAAVANATEAFMAHFIFGEQRWNPERGSLGTPFIIACYYALREEYRSHSRLQDHWRRSVFLVEDFTSPNFDGLWLESRSDLVDPEHRVLDRMEAAELFARLNPRDREIFERIAKGFRHGEIAAELGLTPQTVSQVVSRVRRRLAHEREQGLDRGLDEVIPADVLARAWQDLREWGIDNKGDAARVKEIIDRCRRSYEDPKRTALYRPIPNLELNHLDIILDGIDVKPPGGWEKWMANGARVCRTVLMEIGKELPGVRRPQAGRKGSIAALRRLYRDLTMVSAT